MGRIIQGEGSSPFSRPTKTQRNSLKKLDKKISLLDKQITWCKMLLINSNEIEKRRVRYDQKRKKLRMEMKGYAIVKTKEKKVTR